MRIQQRFQKSDLLWLLAYPLYQIIGTARHEASHALVALVEGAKIEQFVVLPSIVGGQLLWGYVSWSGPTNWVVLAAPYLCDLLTYLLFFFICTRLSFRRHWVWVNLIILGLVSPLVNSGYQYLPLPRPGSDIAWLLYELPPFAVHAYFGVTLPLYVLGLLAILTRGRNILVVGTRSKESVALVTILVVQAVVTLGASLRVLVVEGSHGLLAYALNEVVALAGPFILSSALLISAWGLWRLRPWAYWMAILVEVNFLFLDLAPQNTVVVSQFDIAHCITGQGGCIPWSFLISSSLTVLIPLFVLGCLFSSHIARNGYLLGLALGSFAILDLIVVIILGVQAQALPRSAQCDFHTTPFALADTLLNFSLFLLVVQLVVATYLSLTRRFRIIGLGIFTMVAFYFVIHPLAAVSVFIFCGLYPL